MLVSGPVGQGARRLVGPSVSRPVGQWVRRSVGLSVRGSVDSWVLKYFFGRAETVDRAGDYHEV